MASEILAWCRAIRSCEVRGITLGILSTSSLFTVWSGRKELLKITRREILEEEPEKHFPSYLFIYLFIYLLIWTFLVLRKYFVSKIADAFPRGGLELLAIHLLPKMHCSCRLGERRATIPEPAGGRWPAGLRNCQDRVSSFLLVPRYLCLGVEGTKRPAGREGFPLFVSLRWNC